MHVGNETSMAQFKYRNCTGSQLSLIEHTNIFMMQISYFLN